MIGVRLCACVLPCVLLSRGPHCSLPAVHGSASQRLRPLVFGGPGGDRERYNTLPSVLMRVCPELPRLSLWFLPQVPMSSESAAIEAAFLSCQDALEEPLILRVNY